MVASTFCESPWHSGQCGRGKKAGLLFRESRSALATIREPRGIAKRKKLIFSVSSHFIVSLLRKSCNV